MQNGGRGHLIFPDRQRFQFVSSLQKWTWRILYLIVCIFQGRFWWGGVLPAVQRHRLRPLHRQPQHLCWLVADAGWNRDPDNWWETHIVLTIGSALSLLNRVANWRVGGFFFSLYKNDQYFTLLWILLSDNLLYVKHFFFVFVLNSLNCHIQYSS